MGAQGSQSSVSIREEDVWGELDPGQFKGTNFTSEDMKFGIENQVSNNVRPDRQTTDLVQVGASCEGGFETEFQAENIDMLLPGFLYENNEAGWNNAPADETVSFIKETTSGAGGTMTVTASSVFKVGQALVLNTPLNKGVFLVKELTNATTVTFYEPMTTESAIAVEFAGEYIRNGVLKRSYSIERANNDVSQFFLYEGMTPNALEVALESGAPITASVSFIGESEQLKQSQWGTDDPTELSLNPIMNAVSSVGRVAVDNSALASCLLQKVSFNVNNQVVGKTGVGVLGFCDADPKSLSVSGSIALYFNDQTYYKRYLDSALFGLAFTFSDALGNLYDIQLPACKFDDATANVTGKDDDVMVEGTFVAIASATMGYTIQITRSLV